MAILNTQNNFKSTINLTSPLNFQFCKIITNTQCLIKVSFLKTGYLYRVTDISTIDQFEPIQGLVLAGSKFSYAVGEKSIQNITVELAQAVPLGLEELQLVFYFFNSI